MYTESPIDIQDRVHDLPQIMLYPRDPNPARSARHTDNSGSISTQRASDRSVRYDRRAVVTHLTYQTSTHDGETPTAHQPTAPIPDYPENG